MTVVRSAWSLSSSTDSAAASAHRGTDFSTGAYVASVAGCYPETLAALGCTAPRAHPSRPEAKAMCQMLDLKGMRTRINERGTGDCCVYIHGLGGDLHSWDRLWPFLDDGRRSIRYDLRDFGASVAKSDEAFNHGEDLETLLDALDVDRCDLVGMSMGGGIALGFSLDHPERVRSLALISPQIMGWDWSEQWRDNWQRITDAARAGNLDEAKRLWWGHPMFATTRASPAANEFRTEIERFAGRQWLHDRHALVMPDVERIHQLQTPTLLLTGLHDVDELRLMADTLTASVEDIQRVELEGGHLLQMEVPHLCARHIVVFQDAHSTLS